MMTPTTNIARKAMQGNARYKTAMIISHFLAFVAQNLQLDAAVFEVIVRKRCTQRDVCLEVIQKLDAFSELASECIQVVQPRPK
jgi:hypothetical protein